MPLFVELNQRTIAYLTAVVKKQIEKGEIHRKRSDIPDAAKVDVPTGFSYSYARSRLVKTAVVYSPESRKRKRQTTFHKPAPSSIVDGDDQVSDRDDGAPGAVGPVSADESSDLEEVHA